MKRVYGLLAIGDNVNGGIFRRIDRNLFFSAKESEDNKNKFKDDCCNKKQFECANPQTLKMSVIDYDLNE